MEYIELGVYAFNLHINGYKLILKYETIQSYIIFMPFNT